MIPPIDDDVLRVARELLASARLTEPEAASFMTKAIDPDYWRTLNPTLSIEGSLGLDELEENPLDSMGVAGGLHKLQKEGYFQVGTVFRSALLERMRSCMEKLRAARWPVVFSFVYDEFWAVFKAPSVTRITSAYLGAESAPSTTLWAWYIKPVEGAHGWYPHSDSADQTASLTIWIPLTDSTLDNGCIYIVRKDLRPTTLPLRYDEWEVLKRQEIAQVLQGVRALPAKAGAILGWDQELLHWGSQASANANPRISVASRFVPDGVAAKRPKRFHGLFPTFQERLHIIGKRLLAYTGHEPMLSQYEELAKRLEDL